MPVIRRFLSTVCLFFSDYVIFCQDFRIFSLKGNPYPRIKPCVCVCLLLFYFYFFFRFYLFVSIYCNSSGVLRYQASRTFWLLYVLYIFIYHPYDTGIRGIFLFYFLINTIFVFLILWLFLKKTNQRLFRDQSGRQTTTALVCFECFHFPKPAAGWLIGVVY